MQKNNIKNKIKISSGFTLIETLIYLVIFMIFVTSVISFNSSLTVMRMRDQLVFEVNDQGSKIMKMVTQALHNASQVNSPTITNTVLNLSLATSIPATNPTVFSQSGGVLYMTEGSGSPVALTNNKVVVDNLSFSNFSRPDTSNIIKISFTLSSTQSSSGPAGTYSFTFNGSGALRK